MGADRDDSSDLVRERLFSAAAHHTRAASEKVRSAHRHLRMEAAVHIGAAVELMAKTVLLDVDPRLLYDDREGHHGLIDLLVSNGVTDALPYQRRKKTVSARYAVELASRVSGEIRPFKQAAFEALSARNSAVHAAQVDEVTLGQQVHGGSSFVLAAVDRLKRSRSEFLGEDLADVVQRDAYERSLAVGREATGKVIAARNRYKERIARVPDAAVSDYLATVGDLRSQHGDHNDPYPCPACGNNGWLVWNVEMDLEDEGGGEYSTNAFLDFRGFDCLFCHLQLNNLESEAVGIDPHGDPADDFAHDPTG